MGAEPKGGKMGDEFTIEDDLEKEGDGGEKIAEPEMDEIDTLASEMGWRPDGKDKAGETIDAATYIRKSRDIQDTMRNHIKDQKQQIGDLGNSIEDLKIHNQRVYKAEVSKLKGELATLKSEKEDAVKDGDIEKVDELDEQIDDVKEAMAEPSLKEAPVEYPKFDEWIKTNKWYDDNPEMATYADAIADKHMGAPFERVADMVTKQVKEMFPDKFPGEKGLASSPVEGATKRIATAKFTKADLSESQKTIMKQFVRQGIMTEKAYIEDISKLA